MYDAVKKLLKIGFIPLTDIEHLIDDLQVNERSMGQKSPIDNVFVLQTLSNCCFLSQFIIIIIIY